MKKIVFFILALASFIPFSAFAAKPTITGHYAVGMNTVKPQANVNVPGFVYKFYLAYQYADTFKDSDGNVINDGMEANAIVSMHRFQYTYENTLDWLGNARVHTQVFVPVSGIGMEYSGRSIGSSFGVGDITVNPFMLSWHNWDNLQLSLSFGVVLPNGEWTPDGTGLGKNFWSYRVASGFTWLFGDEKDWAISALFRLEANSRQKHTDIIPGTEFSTEWSFSKKLNKNFEFGIIGAHIWQIQDDKGFRTLAADGSRLYAKDSIHNLGAELVYTNWEKGYALSIGYHQDIKAKGRPEAQNIMFTFGYAF